jgi:hypothetical protein
MRYALIVCSCLCVAAWMNVAAESQAQGPRQNKRQVKKGKPPEPAENLDDKIVWPEETIKGWGSNQADAVEYALLRAQDWVSQFLRQRRPWITWKPSSSYIRKNLVKGEARRLPEFDQALAPGPEGKAECWGVTVAITPNTNREMLRLEREDRAEHLRKERLERSGERMAVLAKLLMALVALLAALAGYLRLEDWTKGYYTWWLRAAVIGFLSFVGLGLLFVA